jgi:N-acetylmuramic acid 6-phosphate etherase
MLSPKPKEQNGFLGIAFGENALQAAFVAGDSKANVVFFEADLSQGKDLETRAPALLLQRIQSRFPSPAAVTVAVPLLRGSNRKLAFEQEIARIWPNAMVSTVHLLEAGWVAGRKQLRHPINPIILYSGLSSGSFTKTAADLNVQTGGWGKVLGDKGSGYEFGLRLLKAILYYLDRDGTLPPLGGRILRKLKLKSPDDLVPWANHASVRKIAALAFEVFGGGKLGTIELDVLAAGANTLAKDAITCLRRSGLQASQTQVLLSGANLTPGSALAQLVRQHIRKNCPALEIDFLTLSEAVGAAEMARELFATGSARRVRSMSNLPKPTGDPYPIRSSAMSPTEARNPRSMQLDKMPIRKAIELMLSEEESVPRRLGEHYAELEQCVNLIARAFKRGGRLIYVGAGTSGRLGVLDASECPPTFGSPPDQVQGIIAGGEEALRRAVEGAEDNFEAGECEIAGRTVGRQDVVVGIAASGTTRFVWGALRAAKARGAKTILLCFNPFLSVPKGWEPTVLMRVNVGPEILTGSTRLKAGTATKLVLNLFTTLAMVRIGKVAQNLMVDLHPKNAKLRDRAVRIVRELSGANYKQAAKALEINDWEIKRALKKLVGMEERRLRSTKRTIKQKSGKLKR